MGPPPPLPPAATSDDLRLSEASPMELPGGDPERKCPAAASASCGSEGGSPRESGKPPAAGLSAPSLLSSSESIFRSTPSSSSPSSWLPCATGASARGEGATTSVSGAGVADNGGEGGAAGCTRPKSWLFRRLRTASLPCSESLSLSLSEARATKFTSISPFGPSSAVSPRLASAPPAPSALSAPSAASVPAPPPATLEPAASRSPKAPDASGETSSPSTSSSVGSRPPALQSPPRDTGVCSALELPIVLCESSSSAFAIFTTCFSAVAMSMGSNCVSTALQGTGASTVSPHAALEPMTGGVASAAATLEPASGVVAFAAATSGGAPLISSASSSSNSLQPPASRLSMALAGPTMNARS
mmetsp:Transcript_52326/g.150800  ORF Transcript_52326/g.150800 Transcript_52326/m.150800 type:complete len:359 (-) Transcript_52326:15-1091(-)